MESNKEFVMNNTTNETDQDPSALLKVAKQKKKTLLRSLVSGIAFIVVTVILFSAQSLAYFTDNTTSQKNRLSSGTVEINLIEMMDHENGGQVTYTDPSSIMPATSVSKIVTVKNSGTLPVYVRIKLDKVISNESELPESLRGTWKELVSCNFNTTEWTYKDGYYYYDEALISGETTAALFDKVAFAASMGNDFANKTISFSVISEATQANGNGTDVFTASGWPSAGGE